VVGRESYYYAVLRYPGHCDWCQNQLSMPAGRAIIRSGLCCRGRTVRFVHPLVVSLLPFICAIRGVVKIVHKAVELEAIYRSSAVLYVAAVVSNENVLAQAACVPLKPLDVVIDPPSKSEGLSRRRYEK